MCWLSRTQKCATLSTSEAEYVAHGDAVTVIALEASLEFHDTR